VSHALEARRPRRDGARRSPEIHQNWKLDDGRFTPLPPWLQPRSEALHRREPAPRRLIATEQQYGRDALTQAFGAADRLIAGPRKAVSAI
jgi:hypothetical protein